MTQAKKARLIYNLTFFVLLLLLFSHFVEIKSFVWGNEWYPIEKENNETFRLMPESASIYFSSSKRKAKINLTVCNYHKPRTLELYLNKEKIGSYLISSKTSILTKEVALRKTNELKFVSKEGCDYPLYVEDQIKCLTLIECQKKGIDPSNISYDPRCLSFALYNLSLVTDQGESPL